MSQRFSALDEFFLQIETPHRPTHWTVVIDMDAEDGAADRAIGIDALRDRIRERVGRYALFRLGADEHGRGGATLREYDVETALSCVRAVEVADDEQWQELLSSLLATPLPRDRPSWWVVLVDQIRPRRQRVVLAGHHSVSDGIAAAGYAALFADGDEQRLAQLDRYLSADRYTGPTTTPREFVRAAGAFATSWARATRSRRLPRLTGTGRRAVAAVEIPTVRVRRAAVRHGAGTAEFLIAAVGAAVADATRPILPAGRRPATLRAFLPATFDKDLRHAGNAVSMILLDTPAADVAFDRRVEAIRERLSRVLGARAEVALPVVSRFGRWLPWRMRTAASRATLTALAPDLHVGVSPAYVNLDSILGLRFSSIYTLSPLLGNPMSFNCLVLGRTVHIGIVWDPDALGDKAGVTAARRITDAVESGGLP